MDDISSLFSISDEVDDETDSVFEAVPEKTMEMKVIYHIGALLTFCYSEN